jgi:hypothetical protein
MSELKEFKKADLIANNVYQFAISGAIANNVQQQNSPCDGRLLDVTYRGQSEVQRRG